MPEKMCAALRQFFTRCYEDEDAKLRKNWAFLEKRKNIYCFYVCTNHWGPFDRGPEANVSNAFLVNTTLLGSSGYFLPLNSLF